MKIKIINHRIRIEFAKQDPFYFDGRFLSEGNFIIDTTHNVEVKPAREEHIKAWVNKEPTKNSPALQEIWEMYTKYEWSRGEKLPLIYTCDKLDMNLIKTTKEIILINNLFEPILDFADHEGIKGYNRGNTVRVEKFGEPLAYIMPIYNTKPDDFFKRLEAALL